jgi:hypothetical protein
MKPSELPGTRSLYRLTNRALAQIRELWQYAGEDGGFCISPQKGSIRDFESTRK